MPETLKDCKCIDSEDKELLIQALNDAIGFNAYRFRKAVEEGRSQESEIFRIRRLGFDELRKIVKNTPKCK